MIVVTLGHRGHVVEIILWCPTSCYGKASMVVVCGVHGWLNIYIYIYIYIFITPIQSEYLGYVYKISISQTLPWKNMGLWVLDTHFLVYIYIYIYIVDTWTHFPIFMYIYIYIYTCWHVLSLLIHFF